jgi:hypothetical protein
MNLSQLIQSKAGNKYFFMQAQTTNIVHPTALYTNTAHASRFPSLWFMPALLDKTENPLKRTFVNKITEDLQRYKPGLILLLSQPSPNKDFLALGKNHAGFEKEWKHYLKTGQFVLELSPYFPGGALSRAHGNIIYDIYERSETQP